MRDPDSAQLSVDGDEVSDESQDSDFQTESRIKGQLFGEDRRVYDTVFDAVMAHRLPPGAKLTEAVLCQALDLPRAVVRMGLLRLAHDHIVELRPNRGAVVASPSLAEARDVYAARRLVEPSIAEGLCGRLNRRQLNQLKKIIQEGWDAFERDEYPRWIELAGEFHVRLAECTGNDVLARFVRELVTRSQLITALYLNPGRTVFTRDARLRLLDYLAQTDPEARVQARDTMDGLLQSVEDRLGTARRAPSTVDLKTALSLSTRN